MKVVVTVDHRFQRTPDGRIWTRGPNAYHFWTRYLSVFDLVKVLGRVEDVPEVLPDYRPADGTGVSFIPVTNYLGPWQYVLRSPRIHRDIRRAVDGNDAVIMRVSSHIAGCLEPVLRRSGRPYGLEVVNDPFDVFAPGSVNYRLRALFRYWFTRQLRRQCRGAAAVAYVTEYALQRRYPCGAYSVGMSDVEIEHDTIREKPVFTTHYSSVELAREDSVPKSRTAPRNRRYRLITVSSLAQMYKAPDVLIRAAAACVAAGYDLTLAIVGDGKFRADMERLSLSLGMGDRIEFVGQLSAGAAIRAQLDLSDLFVLASRCEGLPRAMVEAMARSLPCIGSRVGGIPELIPDEDIVPSGDVAALAAKIQEVLASPERMTRMAGRNLAKAQEYRDDVLSARRRAFLQHVRDATVAWSEAAFPYSLQRRQSEAC